MKNFIYITVLFCATSTLWGQKLSASFAPSVIADSISTDQFDEMNPIYSEDTKTLYFTRSNHPDNKFGKNNSQDVWSTQLLTDSTWSVPTRLPEVINNSRFNNVLSVQDHGQALLISGNYTYKGKWFKRGLAMVIKEGDNWSLPQNLRIKGFQNVNDGRKMYAFMNQEATALFFSFDKHLRGRKNNLFVSLKKNSGKWSRPKKIKQADKQTKNDFAPWLSANGDTLFFTSNRDNQAELYQSIADTNGKKFREWSKPTLITTERLNTANNEAFMSFNKLNDIAFYASDKSGTWNIYKIRRFEKNPYILVKGAIFNQFKNQPIDPKHEAKLVLKEIIRNETSIDTISFTPDSLVFDKTTSSFAFRVPFNKEIVMVSEVNNFITPTASINTKGKYEYGEMTQNVSVEPLLFADVRGLILDTETNEVLAVDMTTLHPQIIVGGTPYNKAKIDASSAFKGIRLALGTTYEISTKTHGYEGVTSTLDLTGFESYLDTTITLFITKQADPFAYVKGVFVSAKDGSKIAEKSKIFLDTKKENDLKTDKNGFSFKIPLNDTANYIAQIHGYLPYEGKLYYEGEDRLDENIVVSLTPIETGMTMVIENVYFANGKSTLKITSYPSLNKVLDFLNEYPAISIEVSGHTDNVGSASSNLKLSERRAKSVGNYFIKNGIAQERIKTKGFGFSKPIGPNDTKENRAKNRRVEFVILKT